MHFALHPAVKTNESDRPDGSAAATASVAAPAPAGRVLRVWIVDDHAGLRDAFSQSLNRQPGFLCTRTFPSGRDLLATLAEERAPDVILLDVNLGREHGIDLIKPILKAAPTAKVVMFTMFRNIHFATEALRAGAAGFLLKTYEIEKIARLVREAWERTDTPPSEPLCAGGTPPARFNSPAALLDRVRTQASFFRQLWHESKMRPEAGQKG